MRKNVIFWLRVSFLAGAVLDLLAGLTMLFLALFAVNNQLSIYYPAPDYHYAIGMGTPFMLAWTVLLPITLLVVLGEVANEIVAASSGYILVEVLTPTWVVQAFLSALFISVIGLPEMRK